MGENFDTLRQKRSARAGEFVPTLKKTFWPNVKIVVLHHYWEVLLSIGTFVIMLETVEHLPSVINKEPFYYGEIVLVGLLLVIAGFLIRMLARTVAEKTQALNTLRIKSEISQQLAAGYDLRGLSAHLVQEIAMFVPGAGVELYLYQDEQDLLYRAASTNIEQSIVRAGISPLMSEQCRACFLQQSSARHSVITCDHLRCPLAGGGKQDFCMQLTHGTWFIGMLHLTAPQEHRFPDEQLLLLENVATDISNAMGIAVRKIEMDELSLAQKINSVQMEIARDLHDTIGQNISYLRMKLEYLAESRADSDISPEIKHMSSVANESYDLVRGTLAMLQPNRSAHMHELFINHAQQIMDRTGLEIVIDCQGEPKDITTRQMRQLFYVFREALNNVEKHAKARRVNVETNWRKHEMSLIITDNGQGFDPGHAQPGSHYGLKFMRERVEQLNGQCSVWSSQGEGTRVTVRFPYETEKPT